MRFVSRQNQDLSRPRTCGRQTCAHRHRQHHRRRDRVGHRRDRHLPLGQGLHGGRERDRARAFAQRFLRHGAVFRRARARFQWQPRSRTLLCQPRAPAEPLRPLGLRGPFGAWHSAPFKRRAMRRRQRNLRRWCKPILSSALSTSSMQWGWRWRGESRTRDPLSRGGWNWSRAFSSRLLHQVGATQQIVDRLAEGARILGLPE